MRYILPIILLVLFSVNAVEAAIFLEQSTAVTVKIGPFLDDTDFNTEETGLTIAQADVRLSKGGAAFAQKTSATSCTHDENGWYGCPLDTTDTGTVGLLQLFVHEAGALPVKQDYIVLPSASYDALIAVGFATSADVADDVWDEVKSGHTGPTTFGDLATDLDSVLVDTTEIGAAGAGLTNINLPNQTMDVTGNITGNLSGSVGSVTGGATASAQTTAQNDLDTLTGSDGVTLATTQSNYAPSKAGDAMTLTAAATSAQLVDDIWDEATSGHQSAGTTGKALTDAQSAGDPWSTALPGAYGAGTAGKIVGDNINSPMATAQTDLDTITGSDGVTLSTAQSNYAPAKAGDSMTLTSGAVDTIFDEVIEGLFTYRQLIRINSAVMAGKLSGGGTATMTFTGVDGTTARVTATVDSSGNRTSQTLDGD